MSLKKIFLVCAVFASLVTALINAGLAYTLNERYIAQETSIAEQLAKVIAQEVSIKAASIVADVEQLAVMPWMIQGMPNTEQKLIDLELKTPGSCSHARLISTGYQERVESEDFPLGFAELELISRAQQSSPPNLALHGLGKGQQRYLAIARPLFRESGKPGVILAYCEAKWISSLIQGQKNDLIAMSLIQDGIKLASTEESIATSAPILSVAVPGSDWTLEYQLLSTDNSVNFDVIIATLITIVIWAILFLMAHYYLSRSFLHDQNSLIAITADLFRGKTQGTYPVKLREFSETISQIALLKRTHAQKQERAMESSSLFITADSQMSELENLSFSLDSSLLGNDGVPEALFSEEYIQSSPGYSLETEHVLSIGKAYGSEVRESSVATVVVGYEGSSAGALQDSLLQGLRRVGCDVKVMNETNISQIQSALTESQNAVFIFQSQGQIRLQLWMNQQVLQGKSLKVLHQRIQSSRYFLSE